MTEGTGSFMRRLWMLLAVSAVAAIGGTSVAAAAPRAPSRSRTERTVIKLSGDEYHDAQNNVVENPRRTRCAAAPGAPATMGCWTWTAKNLGHGTYALGQPTLEGGHIVWTFTYTGSHGDTLIGNLLEGFIPDPSSTDALTHANRYPVTSTFTDGTGRFAGVTGVLTATATKVTTDVDPATGTAHTRFASTSVGTLTFPS